MKKIIVTGCNGQLGRAINRVYENSTEYELVNTDVAELDITSVDDVLKFVREIRPYAIINCAAYTAVEKCENDEDCAFRINAIGPRNLSIAATEVGAKLIHVSTDYVFNGHGTRPYLEMDQTDPLGGYGRTKLSGEKFVEMFAQKYFIVRTAWLYGEGNNFVKTMLRLANEHPEVSVVADQFGTPTSATELAKSIAALLPTDNYGIFHGTCEGSCSWADFAEEIFKVAGKDTKVKRISTAEFGAKVERPAYSVLENYMFKMTTDFRFADWHDALKAYVRDFIE